MQQVSDKREIIVCTSCEGKGIHYREELVDYHRNEHDTWSVKCGTCGGSGLVVQATVVTIEPHTPSVPRGRGE